MDRLLVVDRGMGKKVRCVIWSAVSSRPQAEKDSLDQQSRDARAVCEQRGWEIVAELEVPGHSRTYWQYYEACAEMPAYAELQRLAEAKGMEVVVCRELDRLGRSDSLLSQVQHLLRQNGIQIFELVNPTVIERVEQVSTDRLYVDAFKRARAEDEILQLRRRHSRGMKARIRKGLPASNVPYGYQKVGKDLPPVQIPEQVAMLRRMYDLYVEGAGCRQVAGWLNRNNKPTQRGGRWRSTTVQYTLGNSFYAGWVTYGDLAMPGMHEPVWSAEEWAELKRERRRRRSTRGKSASAFSGLVRCVECGRSMSVCSQLRKKTGRRYHYFRCVEGYTRRTESRAEPHSTNVAGLRIRKAMLEVAERLRDREEMEEELRRVEASREQEALLQQKGELEAALEGSRGLIKRLLDAHTRWGRLSPEAFEEAMDEAAEHQKKLDDALADVLADLEAMPDPETRARRWKELAYGEIKTILDDVDVKRANAWLARYVKAIWCVENRVERVELI